MGIISSISETIERYGGIVNIETNGKRLSSKGFVEPLRYKNKIYIGGEYHRLGFRRTEKYLFVGPSDVDLCENESVIETQGNKYIVKRCEKYFVKDIPIYMWAILVPFGSGLEDDYESN